MMKTTTATYYITHLVLLCLCCINSLWSQETLSFRHIDSRQGLSQNSVFTIAQDGEGFMWFGTRTGLNRYDGYRMQTYEHTPDSNGGLMSNDIRGLYYDQAINKLWICTTEGLNVYDPTIDAFQTKVFFSEERDSPTELFVRCLLRDGKGNLWAGTFEGLYRYNEEKQQFQNAALPRELETSGKRFDVRTLYEDRDGVIWIGSTTGLFSMQADEAGRPDFLPRPVDKATRPMFDTYIQFLTQDGTGRYWIGTGKNGLYSWRPGETPVHHLHDPHDAHTLSDNDIRVLAVDDKGRIWVGTFLGLNIFDESTQRFYRYQQELGNPRSLSGGSVRAIYFDTRGSAWVGTYYGGVSYYSPEAYRFTHHQPRAGQGELSHAVVSSFWEDEKDNVWIGTEGGGINYWDRDANTYQHFQYVPGQRDGLSGNNVKTIIGQGDSIWIGTFATGLYLYRPSLRTWKNFQMGENGLSNNNVYGLLLDEGRLWIATYGGGLDVMDLKTGKIDVYRPHEQDSGSICSRMGRILMKDLKGQVWVGTHDGLDRIEQKADGSIRFHHHLKNQIISSLLAANDSSIWIGTYHQGVFVLGKDGKMVKRFTREDGLPGRTAFGVLEDANGYIWVSTERGLAKIDRRYESIMSYNYSDGLDNLEYNFSSYYKARSGEMFFGGTQGFTSFFPSAVRTNTFVPPVVFTHLLSSNKEIKPGDETKLLKTSLNETTHLTFPYNDANITIGFAAMDFLNPANNHYAYRLEGLDQDWKYVQGQAEVSYTLQRSGTYTFRLKGGNNDGVWNQRERQLTITVLPPPWRSPAAYCIYAILALVLLVGSYRFIQMRHTLQLEQLTAAQQEELHQAKMRFYTNVTHEFRTPLTLILGPVEDLLRKGVPFGGERQLKAIQQNAERLLRLVNQLLNFRNLEHDHNELRVAEGNFVKFIQEVFLSFREQARIEGIRYTFETSREDISLWYDRDKLEKVFYNLLSNAFKFTPKDGAISLKLYEKSTEIGIEVCDSGPGIPEALRPKVFDRFVHQESHVEVSAVGSGIGLALAKQLVEMHGGKIEVCNAHHEGACFRVMLPKGKDHYGPREILTNFKNSENFQAYLDKTQVSSAAKPLPLKEADPAHKQKLLVVEDNPEVRGYVQDIFEAHFELLLAENGAIGLQEARKHLPDLIISDIMMPEMDGIELCSQLKSHVKTSHIPVILLTARTGQIFRVEGLETGADAYLTKPFSPYELQLKVHNLLEARHRIRERFHTVLKLEPKEITVTSADEIFLTKAIEIVEQYMDHADFSVEVFAHELAVSRPLLFTKIKAITSQTPNNFIKSLRLKRSAQLLTQSNLGVAEIAYQVGFRDARYFSKCFQKEFGKTPSEYRSLEAV